MSAAHAHYEAERARLIKLIHVAKRDLRMVDADYRAVLLGASSGAHDSSKAMSITELEKAMSHLKRCGFKVRTKGKPAPARAKSTRPLADDPECKKIRALWLMLHELGAVQNPSEEALAAYVKRITKVDALQWINGLQAETLIETMKKWAMRFLPQAVEHLAHRVRGLPLSEEDRVRLTWLISLARNRGTFDPTQGAYQALTDVLKVSARI